MQSVQRYLALSPNCSLRLLENPCVYDKVNDELYELDRDASDFIRGLPIEVDSGKTESADPEFLQYCLDEGILSRTLECSRRKEPQQSPTPSLRYLLLHITTRCNLKCVHCFLGDREPLDLPLEKIARVMEEFDSLQGLRLLVSGGEPFLHPRFWELNELFDDFSFRTVILSNGTSLAAPKTIAGLQAHEVQVSLDGIGRSHDALRGDGAYQKTLTGLRNLADSKIDVSVATMVHSKNTRDFDELGQIVRSFGAREWNIDVPAYAGRWSRGSPEADPVVAGGILEKAFGGGAHYSNEGEWTCGAHLCAVMTDETICKCGFYAGSPAGTLADGLGRGWNDIPRVKLNQLTCDCDIIEQCKGGCRYRADAAGNMFGKDPIMCAANGLLF